MNTFTKISLIAVLMMSYANCNYLKAEVKSDWSGTFDLGKTNYNFRGVGDTTNIYGIKIEKHWGSNFSTYLSYQLTDDFLLPNVPNFEVDFVEIDGVQVSGDYKDISLGLSGRLKLSSINLTLSLGYTNQRVHAEANLPNIGRFSANNEDDSFFYGFGLEYPISNDWMINLDFKNNDLLTNSTIYSTSIGIEYRF